ncbi:MAG: hypothetical protein KDE22_02395 [Rhodobacterales bacterium]|nr:hypothetical protein [Rhodobacterales bacterium]
MAVGAALALAAGAADAKGPGPKHHHPANPLPGFVVQGSLSKTHYDGAADDLLTGGLGAAGLQGAAPAFADPLNPTAAEQRTRAIYGNYRGVVDMSGAGGYGLFWGPGSDGGPELFPGWEYKAYAKVSGHRNYINNITMVVQIPDTFDLTRRCVIMAPPSGSRGVYGGIAVGEWGLQQGCAVAMGGKGTGTGFHLLGDETADYAVDDIDGVAGSAADIGRGAQFLVKPNAHLRRFNQDFPNRIATKHAHSQINPERMWGRFALNSVEFALWALNDRFKDDDTVPAFRPGNTLVIASGVSNGAGVSVHALEEDRQGLIDGLVVSEPSMNPGRGRFTIAFGDDAPFDPAGQTLYDNIAMMGLYAPCAALDPSLDGSPFDLDPLQAPLGSRQNRCTALYEAGLLTSDDPAVQPGEALAFLNANGYYAEENWGIPSHEWLNLWRTLNLTYGASYGRFAVWEQVCGLSYGETDAAGTPTFLDEVTGRALFADSSGIPLGAGAGVKLIAEDAANGPVLENLAISGYGLQDLNVDGAACFRYLSTGDPADLGRAPTFRDIIAHARVRKGAREVQTDGNLHGKPAIIIHGRQDALVFPNFQSRAYAGLNAQREGRRSKLSYWEVTPAQHFDTFISTLFLNPGTGGAQFAPLHFYLTEGLQMMMDHLTHGDALAPSQVIRATARGTAAYAAGDATPGGILPPPSAVPAAGDLITFSGGTLYVPQ